MICITNEHLPGIRPCTEYGEHRVTCPDHPGWAEQPGECRGCLPSEAERGLLCDRCYEALTTVYAEWDQFVQLVNAAGMRATSPEPGGGGSAAAGYTTLPLTYLALEECASYLKSFPGRLDQWVATRAGARDAVQFAKAAAAAYRSLEVEEREHRWQRVRCPECQELSLIENPTREIGGQVIVSCRNCGHVLNKVRRDVDRWVGSDACSHDEHLSCERATCECSCHAVGRPDHSTGISALFDADLAAYGWTGVDRATWLVLPDGRFTQIRKEAA